MKLLVDAVQLLLILLVLSPVYIFWQSDKINTFCSHVETGMSVDAFLTLADESGLEVSGLSEAKVDFVDKWQASVVSKGPFIDDECHVKGLGDQLATAKFLDK